MVAAVRAHQMSQVDPLIMLANAASKKRKIPVEKKQPEAKERKPRKSTVQDCDPLAVLAAAAEPEMSETRLAFRFGVQNKAMKQFMETHGICVLNPNRRSIAYKKSKGRSLEGGA